MRAVSTNQIADILHFNDNIIYFEDINNLLKLQGIWLYIMINAL